MTTAKFNYILDQHINENGHGVYAMNRLDVSRYSGSSTSIHFMAAIVFAPMTYMLLAEAGNINTVENIIGGIVLIIDAWIVISFLSVISFRTMLDNIYLENPNLDFYDLVPSLCLVVKKDGSRKMKRRMELTKLEKTLPQYGLSDANQRNKEWLDNNQDRRIK